MTTSFVLIDPRPENTGNPTTDYYLDLLFDGQPYLVKEYGPKYPGFRVQLAGPQETGLFGLKQLPGA